MLVKNHEKVVKEIQRKENSLNKILNSQLPRNPEFDDIHQARKEAAKNFLDELSEVTAFIEDSTEIVLVPMETLEKQVAKADFATIEFDGEYCTLALVQNFPYNDVWFLCIAPVTSI